jgi:hypothetical protein
MVMSIAKVINMGAYSRIWFIMSRSFCAFVLVSKVTTAVTPGGSVGAVVTTIRFNVRYVSCEVPPVPVVSVLVAELYPLYEAMI